MCVHCKTRAPWTTKMFKYDLTWNIVGYLKPRTERTYLLIEIPENTELEGGGSTMGYQGGGQQYWVYTTNF